MYESTTSGIPPRIEREWFRSRYGQNFPDFLPTGDADDEKKDELLDTAIDTVYNIFAGVKDIWSHLERDVYVNKTQICYGLLVAWYLTDMYPEQAEGIASSGGIPIKSKKIGGTQITYADSGRSAGNKNNANLLESLKSNAFGAKAYFMIKASGKINFFFQY